MRIMTKGGIRNLDSVRLTRAASAALGRLAFLAVGAGGARADGVGISPSAEVNPCCYIPGVNADYTTAQGHNILNDTSPSGVTTNPSPLSAGLTSAQLTVSGDATSVATSASLNTGGPHVAATSNPGQYTFSQSLWGASLTDGLTFHVSGSGTADITFALALDGTVTVPTSAWCKLHANDRPQHHRRFCNPVCARKHEQLRSVRLLSLYVRLPRYELDQCDGQRIRLERRPCRL